MLGCGKDYHRAGKYHVIGINAAYLTKTAPTSQYEATIGAALALGVGDADLVRPDGGILLAARAATLRSPLLQQEVSARDRGYCYRIQCRRSQCRRRSGAGSKGRGARGNGNGPDQTRHQPASRSTRSPGPACSGRLVQCPPARTHTFCSPC